MLSLIMVKLTVRKLYKLFLRIGSMEVSIIKEDKHEVTLSIDSITVAEVLRVYLVEAGADFAAWRREHPSKPAVFRIASEKGVAKTMSVAINALKKDCDALRAVMKK